MEMDLNGNPLKEEEEEREMDLMKLQAISPDRISTLPEPIIHHILSQLPTKSVKLATSLSKTWYDFCSSFPYLDFDDSSFESMDPDEFFDYEDGFNPDLEPLRERYFNCIGETLRQYHERNPKIPIRRLRIPLTLVNLRFVSLLRQWIQLALEHGVEKMDIINRGYYFNLPAEVFASTSIRVLKLSGCRLLESFRNGDIGVSSSKLRKLVIAGAYINELALTSVISSFPLMEKLAIEEVDGLPNLRISGLYKLKSLVVSNSLSGDIEMVQVHAPVLRCLEFCNNFDRPHFMIGIIECPRLAKLILNNVVVENFQFEEILSRLPLLRSLSLTRVLLLKKFKISNESLEELAVIRCESLVELEINAPNLLSFEFDSNSVPLVGPKDIIMGRSNITLCREPSLCDNFAVKLRNFLTQLDRVNCLCLYPRDLAMISVDEPEERVVQPVINIEELNIIVVIPKSLEDIFNDLLWSYHPRTLTMELVLADSDDVMAFLLAIMAGVGSCCSSSIHWLPYLEGVTTMDGDNNEIQLPMDGTIPSIALESFWGGIKFAFKW